ncbi:hypothetical protein BVY04_01100, partial [bacterium M21]
LMDRINDFRKASKQQGQQDAPRAASVLASELRALEHPLDAWRKPGMEATSEGGIRDVPSKYLELILAGIFLSQFLDDRDAATLFVTLRDWLGSEHLDDDSTRVLFLEESRRFADRQMPEEAAKMIESHAARGFAELRTSYPWTYGRLLYRLAEYRDQLGEFKRAGEYYRAAQVLGYRDPHLEERLGDIAVKRGDSPGAVEHYLAAFSLTSGANFMAFKVAYALSRIRGTDAAEVLKHAEQRDHTFWRGTRVASTARLHPQNRLLSLLLAKIDTVLEKGFDEAGEAYPWRQLKLELLTRLTPAATYHTEAHKPTAEVFLGTLHTQYGGKATGLYSDLVTDFGNLKTLEMEEYRPACLGPKLSPGTGHPVPFTNLTPPPKRERCVSRRARSLQKKTKHTAHISGRQWPHHP